MTSLAVCRGSASAKFFGTSSPMIIDSRVAMATATIVATTRDGGLRQPDAGRSGGAATTLSAGSSVKPVSSVVSVMPSCALERWVEVILSAPMVGPSMRLAALAWRASRSARSRLTSANSLATKKPVPMVRRRPAMNSHHSGLIAHHPQRLSPARVCGLALTSKTEGHP